MAEGKNEAGGGGPSQECGIAEVMVKGGGRTPHLRPSMMEGPLSLVPTDFARTFANMVQCVAFIYSTKIVSSEQFLFLVYVTVSTTRI